MPLITAAEARTWLKIDPGSEADPIIDLLVASVSTDCATFVAGPLENTPFDRYLTGDGSNILILPAKPVISITTLTIQGGANLVAGWDQDYVLTNSTGLIRLTGGGFPNRPGSVHVVWNAGYASIPSDLKVSIMKAVAFNVMGQDKRRAGVTSYLTGLGDSATLTEREYPEDVLNVWKRYRGRAGMGIG